MKLPITQADFVKCVLSNAPRLLIYLMQDKDKVTRLLAKLEAKVDELIVRDILSSFQIIDSLATVDSPNMRDRHLTQAEAGLLKNIALSQDMVIASMPSKYWIAKSYFGLSAVALLRKENDDAAKHLLRAFMHDPRQTRCELAPEIFNDTFRGLCAECMSQAESELKNMPTYDASRAELTRALNWARVKWGAKGAAAVSLMLLMKRPAPISGWLREDGSAIDKLKEQLESLPTPDSIQQKLDEDIDEICRTNAALMLNKVRE